MLRILLGEILVRENGVGAGELAGLDGGLTWGKERGMDNG